MTQFYSDFDEQTRNVLDYALDMIVNELFDNIAWDIKERLKNSATRELAESAIGSIGITALQNKLEQRYSDSNDFIFKELNSFYWGFLREIKANQDVRSWVGKFLVDELAERQPDNFWREAEA